jgi:hypothetical protein
VPFFKFRARAQILSEVKKLKGTWYLFLKNQNEILIEKSDYAKRSNPRRESFLKKKMKRLSIGKI